MPSLRYVYVKNGDAVDQVRRFSLGAQTDSSGPDAFIWDFLRAHRQDDVRVLCRSNHREQLSAGGVAARSFPLGGGTPWGRVVRIISALRIGIEIVRLRPDRLLCGSTAELLWVSAAMARLLRIPSVYSCHNDVQARASNKMRLVFWLDRASIRRCTAVVCHGSYLARQMAELGVAADRTREFNVDLHDFLRDGSLHPMPAQLQTFFAAFESVVLFVGRIQRNKGVFDLLNAFSGLSGRAIGLVYVGDGPDFSALKNRIGALRLERRVLLAGRLAHVELAAIIRGASLLVAPTRPEFPEGRCMTVEEALVSGTPVMAPDFGPFPTLIRHNVNGVLFAPGNAQELQNGLQRVFASPEALRALREGAARSAQHILAEQEGFANAVSSAFDASKRHD